MNLILIIRAELICLFILLFIFLYSRLYKMGKDQGSFLRICIYGIGHIVFDLITVITVNSLDVCPPFLNKLFHIFFYLFALLYAHELFCYIFALCFSKKALKIVRIAGIVLVFIYIILVPFLDIEYVIGNGTNYSFGPAAFVGYGVGMVFFICSVSVVLIYRKRIGKYTVGALLPMLGVAVSAELLQIAIPELLFTGGAVAIITVGFFFSLENPVAVLRHKVFIDAMTGVKSRQSYDTEIVRMNQKFKEGTQYGLVFCDINDLKNVNDTRGHLEGDAYIASIAQILLINFKNASAIYRMGGDEFLAVYENKSNEIICKEIEAAEESCEEASSKSDYIMSIAIGYAISNTKSNSLKEVLRIADYRMYSNKSIMKLKRNYMVEESQALNLDGLTDRIFDAFANTMTNCFIFVTNMATNVTRWSHSSVEYFGLDGAFTTDSINVCLNIIHPDDRDLFFDNINLLFNGRQKQFEIKCRMKNASGNYIVCAFSAAVLSGKRGNPDLLAGTILINNESNN